MKISNKKLAEAKVQKARRDLLKARKDLKEALICGPTGSFTKSTAHSTKIMGYTGLQEDEDFDADFDENELDFADTKTAIDIAFPEANPVVKKIIESWYDAEGTCEDFTDNSEFADYMKNDIEAMLDAADYPERGIVAKELVAKGYVEDDLWSMEESTKKPLTESENASDVKSFDEVQVGDIGKDYADNEVVILAKGPASNFSYADGFEEFVDLSDYDSQDVAFNDQIDAEWPECVLVQFVEDGSEVVYSYGSDGVLVPQSRVRQISFDFIDNGVDEQDLISRIQDAMDVAGITIVGGPAFGDTSWSKEEYGLNEEIIDKGKYGIEVKDPRGLWVPASANYPKNGEPVEFKKEDEAKKSDVYKRLVDRYGEDKVRTYKQGE